MMAQRIVTMCDAHAANDEDAGGAPWQVSLLVPGDTKPTTWDVDLCEDDGKTLRDLAVMLDAIGRRVDGPRRARATAARASSSESKSAHTAPTDEWACPVHGADKMPVSRKALQSHLRGQHDGMSMAKAFGEPEPFTCPEPGCGFTSARPQGIGAHKMQSHPAA